MPEYQKSRGPRYPFAWLGVPLVLLLLFTIGPYVALILGLAVAGVLGCYGPPISATDSCIFMGVDLSGPIGLIGFLTLVTIPIGSVLLAIWLGIAVIVTLIWFLLRWRANANGQKFGDWRVLYRAARTWPGGTRSGRSKSSCWRKTPPTCSVTAWLTLEIWSG
jgi:hypothetical protein